MLRVDCTRWLDDLDRDTPTVVLGVKDARGDDVVDARASIDGGPARAVDAKPIALDPGPHVIRFERPGSADVQRTVVTRTGERNRLVIERLAGAPPSSASAAPPLAGPASPGAARARSADPPTAKAGGGMPPTVWIASGVGVVGLTAFAVLGGLGMSEKSDLRGQCGSSCTDEQISSVRTLYVAADVSLVVSLISFGVAAWVALTAP